MAPGSCPIGAWARARVVATRVIAKATDWSARLLLGCIVALFPERPEQRHAARLHQLDLDFAVLAVPRRILWRVAKDVLVAQFDTDFCGHVGKFVEVIHRVLTPSCLFGNFGQ